MRLLRLTTGDLSFLVAIVAVDCVFVQILTTDNDQRAKLDIRIGLAMANLIPALLWRSARSGRRPGPFLAGFLAFGLAAVTGQVALFRADDWLGFRYQFVISEWVGELTWAIFPDGVERDFLQNVLYAQILVYSFVIPTLAVALAVPQFLLATVGGLLVRECSRAHADRPAPRPDDGGCAADGRGAIRTPA